MPTIYDCTIIQLPKIENRAGNISPIQGSVNIPFEIKKYDSKYLIVQSPKDSAKKILNTFKATSQSNDIEKKSIEHSIIINAAMALYLCDYNNKFSECYDIAKENIYNGKALKKLNQLIEFTNRK